MVLLSRSRPTIPSVFCGIVNLVERCCQLIDCLFSCFLMSFRLFAVDHPDTASYPEDFISDARAVVSRVQVSWKDITIERIRRVLDRISRKDWRSDLLPLITGNKLRFSIFSSAEQKIINAAREMKELPDLSALIKKKLSGAKKASSATPSETTPSETTPREETPREKIPRGAVPPTPLPLVVSPGPSTGPANVDSSREDLALISERGYEVTQERFRVQTAMIAKSNKRFSQIRDLEKRRSEYEVVRSLQSQAFGTKKCLEALKESGTDIPQEMIDLFAEQEKEHEAAAELLAVGGIPEELLCLSPLHLRSPFLNENVWAAIDPYGSNAGLIDAGTAAFLQTPSSSQGDHVNGESVEPSGRELGEPSFQEGRSVGEVARLEDTTVAPALDPIALSTDLVVNEDPLVSVLETGAETRTEPVHLLELSDSSTEEEGGEHLEETEPGLVGNPQNEEGAVDRTDDLPVLPADVTVQVVEGGSNRAED
ncbi:uncharacterized protein LOC108872268 [Brassica rapa]|uniref:uncharacterized protein LOC108872268 n=1 Tax=Brassica campestris TaxID=3711 RepID=UPI00142D7BC8|nr:uncharacterized protein LOC108872268 [Brassica rapa]